MNAKTRAKIIRWLVENAPGMPPYRSAVITMLAGRGFVVVNAEIAEEVISYMTPDAQAVVWSLDEPNAPKCASVKRLELHVPGCLAKIKSGEKSSVVMVISARAGIVRGESLATDVIIDTLAEHGRVVAHAHKLEDLRAKLVSCILPRWQHNIYWGDVEEDHVGCACLAISKELRDMLEPEDIFTPAPS